jgi:hypothetical protein
MRVDYDTSSSIVVEQIVGGVTVFDGSAIGRAALSTGAGNSEVIFRARKQGADFNGYKVRMIDPGIDTPAEIVTFDPGDTRLDVVLRKAAGAITSTAIQVATAVQRAGHIVTAAYGGNGTGTVAATAGTLTGAIDPTVVRNSRYTFSPAGNAGLFTLDQTGNVLIRQFEAKLSASVAWTLTVINLDEGYREDASSAVQVANNTGTDVYIGNLNLVLSPLRALKFAAAAQGVARVVAHKEPNFPFM